MPKQARTVAPSSTSPVDRILSLGASVTPSRSDISDVQGSSAALLQEADANKNPFRHEDTGVYPCLSCALVREDYHPRSVGGQATSDASASIAAHSIRSSYVDIVGI